MKVLLLTTSYPRWRGDPGGSFVEGFANALAHEGHQVHVLAPAWAHGDSTGERAGRRSECAGEAAQREGAGEAAQREVASLEGAGEAAQREVASLEGAGEAASREGVGEAASREGAGEAASREGAGEAALREWAGEAATPGSDWRGEHSASGGALQVRWVRYLWPPAWQRSFHGAGVPANARDPRVWPGLVTFPCAARLASRGAWDAVVAHFGIPSGVIAATIPAPRQLTIWHSADVALATRAPRTMLAPLMRRGTHWFVRESHQRALATRATQALVRPMGATQPTSMPRADACALLGLDPDRPIVLFLGRLVPMKGGDVFLRADLGDAQRIVAGDGPERHRLAAMAPPSARLLGSVHGRKKHACFAAADVIVLPSRCGLGGRREGAPVVAIEAALAGVPRVASTVVGLPADEASVVPPDDPVALGRAVRALLEDSAAARRLAERARARAQDQRWDRLAPFIDRTLRKAWV